MNYTLLDYRTEANNVNQQNSRPNENIDYSNSDIEIVMAGTEYCL